MAAVGYAAAFLADLGVPRTVDAGGPRSNATAAALVDVVLLGAFAAHHSTLARPAVKRRLTAVVPPHLERSCYVLAASVLLGLLCWQWRPLPRVVWHVGGPPGRAALWGLCGLGWAWALAMTFAIDHLELVGLRQVRDHRRGDRPAAAALRAPWPYRLVRHPMMTGLLVAFAATPSMTAGHLLFAGAATAYVVVAVRFEERDLADTVPGYREHAAGTPRFVPRPWRLDAGRR